MGFEIKDYHKVLDEMNDMDVARSIANAISNQSRLLIQNYFLSSHQRGLRRSSVSSLLEKHYQNQGILLEE